MKRYTLCSLFLLGLFGGTASAAPVLPLPAGQCYETNGGANYNMIIYFENDFPESTDTNFDNINDMFSSATGGARACYQDMKRALKTSVIDNITKEDEAIFLLASTDTLAGHEYNVDLATRRAGLAMKALAEAGLPDDILKNQVKVFIGGESNAASESPESGSNPKERAVRIIVKQANDYTPPAEYHAVKLTNNINIYPTKTVKLSTSITTQYDDTALLANQMKTDIGVIAAELNRMNDTFGRSHWKTKDGGFNTARLASDSIAGVVLGTAGGLITSNIIKKNQIRGGFEDLQCVIGGQIVADYNDDFTTNMNLRYDTSEF